MHLVSESSGWWDMRFSSIQGHLRPYKIVAKRATTINHAFAAAIAPSDLYDGTRVKEAIKLLGQNPDTYLRCVYCDAPAKTWDHVFATVKQTKFSGFGHRLGNLVPCCKPCNSEKGNKHWEAFLHGRGTHSQQRVDTIGAYLKAYHVKDAIPSHLAEYQELEDLKQRVLELLAEADQLAARIRGLTANL